MREALGEARPAIDLEQKVGNLDARQQIIRCIPETLCLRRSHRTKRRDFEVTFCQVDIGELATSIAHEVNQPLGAIVNNGNVCLRLLTHAIGVPDEMREALLDIVNDANRASAIVAEVRALTKRSAPAKTSIYLNDAIADVFALARRDLADRHIKVRNRVAEDLPGILVDRQQFHQVLLDLVMNAIDAMSTVEEQSRILTIWGQRDKLKEKPAVLIGVQDLGEAFAAEVVDLLFEPLYTAKREGMGMGLRISRSIVEAHGGRLWAKPNPNRGATFFCILPVALAS